MLGQDSVVEAVGHYTQSVRSSLVVFVARGSCVGADFAANPVPYEGSDCKTSGEGLLGADSIQWAVLLGNHGIVAARSVLPLSTVPWLVRVAHFGIVVYLKSVRLCFLVPCSVLGAVQVLAMASNSEGSALGVSAERPGLVGTLHADLAMSCVGIPCSIRSPGSVVGESDRLHHYLGCVCPSHYYVRLRVCPAHRLALHVSFLILEVCSTKTCNSGIGWR